MAEKGFILLFLKWRVKYFFLFGAPVAHFPGPFVDLIFARGDLNVVVILVLFLFYFFARMGLNFKWKIVLLFINWIGVSVQFVPWLKEFI